MPDRAEGINIISFGGLSLLGGRRALGGRRFLDGLLLILLVGIVFLLGCYELGDSDIWWHLRGGQWILENGRAPHLDPFTFGSADKVWVDIHWSYEVLLALAYRAGGIAALILLGATAGAGAFAAVLTARRREWPVAAVVLCWLPALVLLSFRLDPRPEMISLLYLGGYLAILWRVEERPALAWLLPILQLLWVNVQGLFILGPVLLGLFVAAQGARALWRRAEGTAVWTAVEKRWWRHVGGAGAVVLAACLCNPYFLDGVRFPFELFPKVTDPKNPYKQYIDELQSPAEFLHRFTLPVAGTNWFFLAWYFLLPLLLVSFLYPAAWRAWGEPRPTKKKGRPAADPPASAATGAWLGGLAVIVALLVLRTLTLSGKGPAWLNVPGDNVPLIVLLGGGVVAFRWYQRSPAAAAIVGVGGAALAAYLAWLDATLVGGRGVLGGNTSASSLLPPLVIAGGVAGLLVLRWGGDLFRILLAGAFSYLALQALQNWTRAALVGGAVLTWNFAEWASRLPAVEAPDRARRAVRWGLHAGLLLVLGGWIAALLGDRFYVQTGMPRHFAFREEPLAFAHDAARFAGQPGLPERALVYGLDQACVYTFHNAPRCKPFLDGRLEMPDLRTFQTYVDIENWLEQPDPRWEKAVANLGDPLLLIGHQGHSISEARLLCHPDWRCIYFDALAAVFVPTSQETSPPVDFAARHFRHSNAASVPAVKGAAAREQKALFNLAASLPRSSDSPWRRRIPVLLAALDRGRLAVAEDARRPDVWVLLGAGYWHANPHLADKPLTPAEDWDVARGIWWAQATCCLRQALKCQPDHPAAWRYLYQCFRVRGMVDAQAAAGDQWALADPRMGERDRQQIGEVRAAQSLLRPPVLSSPEQLPATVAHLLSNHRPEAAAQLLEVSGPASWDWPFAERVAGLYMHLGRPAEARRVWEQARACPSASLRSCRVASTFWAEGDLEAAIGRYRKASENDPQQAEPWWALALLYTEQGEAAPAYQACEQGRRLSHDAQQSADLEALRHLLLPYVSDP
jgi:tetratricopeptide (TPR) repeat protein